MTEKTLIPAQRDALLSLLKTRYEKNMNRHPGISWAMVTARLAENPGKLWSLSEMERTGGEPDVVGPDPETGACIFMDCSAESPAGRRSVCYDRDGRESRKEHAPLTSAEEMCREMGIDLISKEQYLDLQKLGKFDTRTSSWVKTPVEMRRLGGALFADYRYGQVFFYHNSAPSYYASRGFRGMLSV